MSEHESLQPVINLISSLQQIACYCINPNAYISPLSDITLEMSPDGKRHTQIDAAKIKTGAQIGGQVYLGNNTVIEEESVIKFRSTIGEDVTVGKHAVVGVGVNIEDHVELIPGSKIGNFARIGKLTTISWVSEVGVRQSLTKVCLYKEVLDTTL